MLHYYVKVTGSEIKDVCCMYVLLKKECLHGVKLILFTKINDANENGVRFAI